MTGEQEPEKKAGNRSSEEVIRVLDLYETREKIQTRQLPGFYRNLQRWTWLPMLSAYFLLPWINLDGRQAIWLDRKSVV